MYMYMYVDVLIGLPTHKITYTEMYGYTMVKRQLYIYIYIHVLMRDEKKERKKQARSNKQTRQSNTAHPRQSLFLEHVYMYIHVLLLLL